MMDMWAVEAAGRWDTTDYFAAETVNERHGMINGVYYLPTGRWYVIQKVTAVQERGRRHWPSRCRVEDHLDLALANDPDPMMWVAFPLGTIPMDLWQTTPAERRAGWRWTEVAKFWVIAYPRERHWVDNLRSMWTKGWNSQYPGKPAFSRQRVVSETAPQSELAKDIEAAKTAIRQWEADTATVRRPIRGAPWEDLIKTLERLEKGLSLTQQSATTAAISGEVPEVLRGSQPILQDLDLPGLLKEPEVYKLHPEPDVAAAIMVVHRFVKRIATALFNFKVLAQMPAPVNPNERCQCQCLGQVLPGATLMDGHVLATNPEELASPYLMDIVSKDKQFGFPKMHLP